VERHSCKREYATVIKECSKERQSFEMGTLAQHQHQMLVGIRDRTSTNRYKGCLRWQIVWCVKGLMNHTIHKSATNVELLRTHTRGSVIIKVEWISSMREYATLIWECNNERQSFIKGSEAWGSKTKITTPTLGNREQTSTNRPHDCLLW
jgi:hypothetical protein